MTCGRGSRFGRAIERVQDPSVAKQLGETSRQCLRDLLLLRSEQAADTAGIEATRPDLLADDAHDDGSEYADERAACTLTDTSKLADGPGQRRLIMAANQGAEQIGSFV